MTGMSFEALMALLGGADSEHPVHIYPAKDPFGHEGVDDCPCGPILRKIEWEEITYWAMAHPALDPTVAYRQVEDGEDP